MQTNEDEVQINKIPDEEDTPIKLIYARFGQRVYAYIIDGVVLFGVSLLEFAIAYQLTKNHINKGQLLAIDTYMSYLTGLLYFAIMESSDKRATIGKKSVGIQVTDLQCNRISFLKALIRNFIKFIVALSMLIYYIFYPFNFRSEKAAIEMLGYLFALFLPKRQALHDVIAGTIVLSNINNMKKYVN